LVLEKDNGTVQRIVNGKMLPEPVLDVIVANKFERGLLGIAVAKHNNNDQQQQQQQEQQKQENNSASPTMIVEQIDGSYYYF
jgi:hypothetical protein